jgi:NAD(P)-dependent dehydrogenase (short-subunit alcohol dehydrogenase family)
MKDFKGKVAVVTGAAGGIGRALAERFAAEGMSVVLADIDRAALAKTEQEMKSAGAAVVAVPADVSKADEVEALAKKTMDAFGAVHIVCNNAGVATPSATCWEAPLEDWQWIFGINFWGVIHGIRTFVPILLEQGEGHIVNTASLAGVISSPLGGPYQATKHAVLTVSETLYGELKLHGGNVGVTVVCPGFVRTAILESVQQRFALRPRTPLQEQLQKMYTQLIDASMPPSQVAGAVFQAVREERLYVFTHSEMMPLVQQRFDNILAGRNPDVERLFGGVSPPDS